LLCFMVLQYSGCGLADFVGDFCYKYNPALQLSQTVENYNCVNGNTGNVINNLLVVGSYDLSCYPPSASGSGCNSGASCIAIGTYPSASGNMNCVAPNGQIITGSTTCSTIGASCSGTGTCTSHVCTQSGGGSAYGYCPGSSSCTVLGTCSTNCSINGAVLPGCSTSSTAGLCYAVGTCNTAGNCVQGSTTIGIGTCTTCVGSCCGTGDPSSYIDTQSTYQGVPGFFAGTQYQPKCSQTNCPGQYMTGASVLVGLVAPPPTANPNQPMTAQNVISINCTGLSGGGTGRRDEEDQQATADPGKRGLSALCGFSRWGFSSATGLPVSFVLIGSFRAAQDYNTHLYQLQFQGYVST